MSKVYAANFQAALNASVNALVTCWQITLEDGTVLGFTDGDRPLAFGGVSYLPEGGFQPSDVDRDLNFSPNQISLKSYFSQQLPLELFTSGRIRDAVCFVFRVDPYNLPTSLSDDPLTFDPLVRGRIGKISLTDVGFTAELAGLQDRLGTKQGWVTSANCRFEFCDPNCGLNIANFTDTVTVSSATNRQFFIVTSSFADNYYTGGKLIWQTGGNAGLESTCIYSNGSTLGLLDRVYTAIQPGDTATITRACDKKFATCTGTFGNGVRFGGEPGIPAGDTIKIAYNSDDKT